MSNEKFAVVGTNIREKATMIWNVADLLRGPFKPHEYGLVILPMTVVKRFHDCLLPTLQAVLDTYERVKKLAVVDGFLRTASGYQFYNTSKFTFDRLLACEASVGGIALLIAELFPRQLIRVFGAANESAHYTDFAVHAFRIYLCMMVFACVNKACFIFLQAMGKPVESAALSMIREIVFGVGFALLLPVFFGLDGVLYSMPLSDILTFFVAAFLIVRTYRQLNDSENGKTYNSRTRHKKCD